MDSRSLTLALSCNNNSLTIGKDTPVRLIDYEGLEAPTSQITTAQMAQGWGSVVTGKSIASRNITLTGEIADTANTPALRQELIRLFDPQLAGTLTVDYCGIQRTIDYYVESFRFSASNLYDNLQFSLSLLCPQPYLLGIDNFGQDMAGITKMLAFPFVSRKDKGFITGYRTLRQEANIINDGDVDTGLEIHFIASRGPVTSPSITRVDTGEFLRIETQLAKGDTLIVDTNSGKKRVTLNGDNVFHKIDRQSSFFQLSVGGNVLEYNAEENYTNLNVKLYYTPKYLGV